MISELKCHNPFNFLELLPNPKAQEAAPPALPTYIIIKERKVSFNEIVNVVEYGISDPEDDIEGFFGKLGKDPSLEFCPKTGNAQEDCGSAALQISCKSCKTFGVK